ncbi:MAG: sialic acid-specific 9-O-acetylesterase [Planctomycetaceae bacterium]|nr:sialic acid-specific 9-O-acetylesterase [Planctomycetaceae bacterium]
MMNVRWRQWMIVLLLGLMASTAQANVRLPAIIGNNMVLQKDIPLPIWGWADAGEEVTVTLGTETASAKADATGKWKVTLKPVKVAGGPHAMTVKGKNEIKIENILIGEVWAGSGQSNMQWAVSQSINGQKEVAEAKFPKIRLFIIPLVPSGTPAENVNAQWVECSPQTVGGSSAVLFFFGREIHQKLDLPVGLITTAWGGTAIQPWIPPQGYNAIPELAGEKAGMQKALSDYDQAMVRYNEAKKAHDEVVKAAKPGTALPAAPVLPPHPLNSNGRWTGLYNGMIHPIVPFGIRGFLWYQGESNNGQGMHYFQLKKGLIEGWRQVWNQEGNRDFPFLFAQLAPYNYGPPRVTDLPGIWEAQTETLTVKNTGMAVLTDIATVSDIHPPNKQEVGRRLALWALANTYDKKDLVYSGPLFKDIKIEGDKIRVNFNHSAGLKSRDGKDLSWWAIAGEDKKFVKAQAKIEGDSVIVSAEGVTKPVAVRFGWNQLAEPNLSNGAGLPASPFRSDKWTDAVNNAP